MIKIISKYSKYVSASSLVLTLALSLVSCADDNNFWGYWAGQPGEEAEYEYLTKYDALKTYVDRSAHPIFKPSLALSASDYDNQTNVYAVANANFDEIVAGNAMKMASCVSDKGAMDFTLPTNFVNTAEDAGMSVYGHVLAWHSQQPVKWLDALIADKEIEGKTVTKTDYELDCSTLTGLSWSGCPDVVTIKYNTNGGVQFSNSVAADPWYSFQYWLVSGIALTTGKTYKVKVELGAKSDMDLVLNFKLGDWGGGAEKKLTVPAGTTEKEIEFEATPAMDSNGLFFQNNDGWVGSYVIKKITITHEEAAAVEVEKDVFKQTYTDGPFPYYVMGCAPPVVNASIHFVGTGAWSQFFSSTGNKLTAGQYRAYVRNCGSAGGSFNFVIQNGWGGDAEKVTKTLKVKEGWSICQIDFSLEQGGSYDIIVQPGTYVGTFDLNYIDVKKVEKMNKRPLTDQEKKDTLTWAMTQWCNGMMNATSAKVKAWDMINEAVSGSGDVEGYYALQHGTQTEPGTWDVGGTNFFWQDYFGDEDYGPIVEKAARDAFVAAGGNAEELKLFVNDYNLESDWDQNKKVKSLIYWVNKWEQRGKTLGYNTKIDGLGTQMHISYYENETTQNSKKAAIQEMFKLMAATGKLIRVSELDMGYVDKDGNSLTTAQIKALPADQCLAKEKAMADFYQWIIEQYFTLVPAAQQYGICQWCATDSPAGSGWRAGQPVGLWNESYKRKPAYGGWAEGLKK